MQFSSENSGENTSNSRTRIAGFMREEMGK
jgi:hypothetical protein